MRFPAFAAGLFFFLTACDKNDVEPSPDTAAMTQLNVPYGTDEKQRMDIYLPAGRSRDSTRVVVLIHGGGWIDGDKADFSQYVTVLQQQFPDYAIFNINYRLAAAGTNLFPAQEEDVNAAVNFIHDSRDEYKISDNFVYLGASAGAHLALLQGYKHKSVVAPTAIIDLFGPTELKSLYSSAPAAGYLIGQLLGTTPMADPGKYDESSPLFYADATSAPTLILQGGRDNVVPPSQSELLKTKLLAAGVSTGYVYYPQEGHGWTGASLTDTFAKVVAFLRAHP